jgi:Ser/Thr protein kinase RdoA (MazF antagonist)
MKHRPTAAGELFERVMVGEEDWRFVLFEWLEGEHLTHGSVTVAEKFGRIPLFKCTGYTLSTSFNESSL